MKLSSRERVIIIGLCLLLIAGVVAVYAQTAGFGLVAYDDPFYVTVNPQVLGGLTWDGVKWAFTTMHAGNWFPLVWLSLMLDRTLGAAAGGFHLVNIALHIANTILLFWVLKRYTKAVWASFFVSALFALHPLHVESVAWITERKDVLSMLFWLLTMLAYLRYVEIPTTKRYVIICAVFSLGLMSKSMLVTLPFVLVLMDYWPLKQLWPEEKSNSVTIGRLLFEKIPLLSLSVASCVMTVIAQKSWGAVAKISIVPFNQRVGNALVSYCDYILKTFWPVDLAVFYPHPIKSLAVWKVAVSLAVLVAITIVVILLRRRRYLLVGWFWYVGTLVPVIGLVQVGGQALADRYTYVPLTGIFIMLAWAAGDFVAQRRFRQILAGVASSAIIGVLGAMTFVQVSYWRDTMSLFTHCAAVTPDNVIVRKYLGIGFAEKGDPESAVREFEAALRFEPNDTRTLYNIAGMQARQGRIDEAIEYYNRVLKLKPGDADTCVAIASIRAARGEFERAIDSYREGLKYNSGDAEMRSGLGLMLLQLNRVDEGITELEQSVKIKADSAAYCNLGLAWAQKGRLNRAMECYAKSIQLNPDNANTRYNLGNAYFVQNMPEKAIAEYRAVIRAMPDFVRAYDMLAIVLIQTGKIEEATATYEQALKIDSADKNARVGLEKIRAAQKEGSPKQ
ncbi:MAG: tetratricopeptide repeat protein [Sedimentisphaerales bacterium]|jgi:tetratricopeptide (TPR) repeat protein